jgi:hypothetical protein
MRSQAEFGRNNVTKPERDGRPESTDGRGDAENPTSGGGDGEPQVRRRRVVLHQGLPDPVEPEGGAKFVRSEVRRGGGARARGEVRGAAAGAWGRDGRRAGRWASRLGRVGALGLDGCGAGWGVAGAG